MTPPLYVTVRTSLNGQQSVIGTFTSLPRNPDGSVMQFDPSTRLRLMRVCELSEEEKDTKGAK